MKRYKLIKEYPNSPKLGSIILNINSEFYSIKPDNYPEFWQEFIPEKSFISEDGVTITEGDKIWVVESNLSINNRIFISDLYIHDNIRKIFSTIEKAKEYVIFLIELPIENETIKGEDIVLYTLLLDRANYMIGETTTSLKLFTRDKTKSTIRSNKWKYFRTEKERDDYLYNKVKIFSRDDVKEMFKSFISEFDLNFILSE